MHGSYLHFNVETNNVCAAGVINNGFVHGSSPWAKIEIIACHNFEVGYGSLLMKHMVNATNVEIFFVNAVTNRQRPLSETRLRISNKINRQDTIPFYERYGFRNDYDMQRDHKNYISDGNVAMLSTNTLLTACMRSVTKNDLEHIIFYLDLHTFHSVRKKMDNTE